MIEPDARGLTGPTSTGVEPRVSALLCYAAWWVSGLVFLIIEQQHRVVRFHAAQSIVVFGGCSVLIALFTGLRIGMLIVSAAAFSAATLLVYVMWIATVGLWCVMMVKTFRGETWRVPLASDLADRIAES